MSDKLTATGNKKLVVVCLLLAAVTLAVFWQVRLFDFISYDDPVYVTENLHTQSGLTSDGIKWAFETKRFGLWNPLIWISFMMDHQLYGMNPGGYHVTNLILHLLSTLLLFGLFHRMTHELWKSAFVAAFFALHPLHVESVAWVSERKDVLSAFFWMLTLYLYVYYTEKPALKRYLLVLCAFVLALMSKPMVVTLPVIMILLDVWPMKRFENRKGFPDIILWQLKEKLPLFILSAAMILIMFYPSTGGRASYTGFPLEARIANAPIAFVIYLVKTFWPHNLAFFYPFPPHIPVWQVATASLLIIAVSATVIFTVKRAPFALMGWLWFTITILPVIGIIQIGEFSMTDRYHYLPSIGISVIVAWGIALLFRRKNIRKTILLPAGVVFLLIMSLLAWKQCGTWENNVTLYSHALKTTENNHIAHNNLGLALAGQGRFAQAVENYNEVIRLRPNDSIAHKNKALALEKLGNHRLAVESYHEAIRLHPDDIEAYNGRAINYGKLGQHQKALDDFQRIITLNPLYADAYFSRGSLYLQTGQPQKALDDFHQALRLKPDNAVIHYNRGNAYIHLGDLQNALTDLSRAVTLDPTLYDAYNNRGFIHIRQGNYRQALDDYNQTIRLKPDYGNAYNNRAFVHLNMGNIPSACADAQKACTLGSCATLQLAQSKGLCR